MSVTAPGAAMTSGSVPTSPTRTKDVPGARRRPPFGGLEERGGRRKDASVAVRVAEELGERLGDVVGCAVRGDVKMSTRTALLFCTVGVRLDRFCP